MQIKTCFSIVPSWPLLATFGSQKKNFQSKFRLKSQKFLSFCLLEF